MKPSAFALALLATLGSPFVVSAQPAKTALPPSVREAADKGDPEAMFQLGRAHLHGKGAAPNRKKAFELMSAAAAKGHPEATGAVGWFYSKGFVVKKDPTKAIEWFRKAAEMGSAKAQWNLAHTLLEESPGMTPEEIEKNRKEGISRAKQAADANLPEACLNYGLYLRSGEHGLVADKAAGLAYLIRAAKAGNPSAANHLGVIHESGDGVPVDDKAAREWYTMAARGGHIRAQSNLGRMIGPESADPAQRIEALAWLLLASQKGDVMAEKSLADVSPALKGDDLPKARSRAEELRKEIAAKDL